MATQKVRFTLWMDPEVLRAAKLRAASHGGSASEVIATAARAVLIDAPQDAETRIVQSLERVAAIIQRSERRRTYDEQVLKEMVGLLVQSFFNHTPAVPDHDKKAALHSGKVRFNRFLDALAANLRGGQSILNDLPANEHSVASERVDMKADAQKIADAKGTLEETLPPTTQTNSPPTEPLSLPSPEQSPPAEKRPRWSLFG